MSRFVQAVPALEVSASCRPKANRETSPGLSELRERRASALPSCPSLALQTMPRASRPLVCLFLVAAGYVATQLAAFVAAPAAPKAPRTQLQARGGGEYDVSDADIESFYQDSPVPADRQWR